jgi:hypothetical protein
MRTTLILGLLMSLVSCAPVLAQASSPEKVRIETRDGVQLRGTFYSGAGRSHPGVLFVHELGDDSQHRGWKELAKALQKEGFAVLAFDLRGHGESTEVDDNTFWSPVFPNRAMVRSSDPQNIRYKNFDRRYYPALANDIAAAKAFLDRKNDAGECNSSNLIVIGAGSGATLAAIWINAEWHRFQFTPGTFGIAPQIASAPEGEKILAAIFVSIDPVLGGRSINLPALLDVPGRLRKMPIVLMHGDGHVSDKRVARGIEKSLKSYQKLPLTGAVAIPNAGTDRGTDLLQPGLGTNKAILDYLETVMEEKGEDWQELDFERTLYVWRMPRAWNQPMPANEMRDRTLFFQSFEGFLPR